MRLKVVALCWLALASVLNAQTKVDSLRALLGRVQHEQRVEVLRRLSLRLRHAPGNEGLAIAEQAMALADSLGDKKGMAWAHYAMGINYREKRAYELAHQAFDQALLYFESNGSAADRITVLSNVGRLYRQEGRLREALTFYHRALAFLKEGGDRNTEAMTQIWIGICYDRLGEHDPAVVHFKAALSLYEASSSKRGMARALNNLGIAYVNRGMPDKALDYYLRALHLKEDLGQKRSMATTLNNIGIVYKKLNQLEKALDYYTRSMVIKDSLGNENGVAVSLNNIGIIHMDIGDYIQALAHFEKALAMKRQIGVETGVPGILNNIGRVNALQNRPYRALSYFKRSLALKEKRDDRRGIAETLNHIGCIHIELNELHRARAVLDRGRILCKQLKLRDRLLYNYECTHRLALKQRDYAKAQAVFYDYSALKDSIFSDRSAKAVAELETRYQLQMKESEIELLKRDNTIQTLSLNRHRLIKNFSLMGGVLFFCVALLLVNRNRSKARINKVLKAANTKITTQKEELELLNTTKDRFFSLIAHDLKSPILAQLSGTRLLSRSLEEMDAEEVKSIVIEMGKNTEKLYRLLENLLQWARAQMGSLECQPQQIHFDVMINSIIAPFMSLADQKQITLSWQCSDNFTLWADTNMLRSIIQNLLSNAIKFTPHGGTVTVTATGDKEGGKVSVFDSGVGISSRRINKLLHVGEHVSTEGTDAEKGTGLGLLLCQEFVRMHNGTLHITSQVGQGTHVCFTLPTVKEGG